MTPKDITPHDALTRLGASSAAAVARVLETFAPGQIERGEVTVLADGNNAFAKLMPGTIAASVSYVDGVTGGNVFVMTPDGARALAVAMGVPDPDDEAATELTELELSAVSECANQMMAATAAAISVILGQEIEISPPDTRVLAKADEAADCYGKAPHATATTFTIAGESCRLIQLVPSAFVMRMARAIDELAVEDMGGAGAAGGAADASGDGDRQSLHEALGDIKLRVWAELGRTRLPLSQALALPAGAVVELDVAAEAPINLFVNGLCFAQGRLLLTDDGEWGVRLETVGGPTTQTPSKGAVS